MAKPLSELVIFLRLAIDDGGSSYQEFSDSELENYLRFGCLTQLGDWALDYSLVLNEDSYEITPDPPDWLSMLFVLKTCLMMKIFTHEVSYDNRVIKVTNTSKKEELISLKELHNSIIQERRYGTEVVGYSFNSFDDLLTRPYDIQDELNEGYR